MRKILFGAALMLAGMSSALAIPVAGSYGVISSSGATITNLLADPFSLNLVVGTPQTFDLANIVQHTDGTSTVTATFNFTAPTTAGPSTTLAADVFSTPGASTHDSLTWSNAGLAVVNFSDGAILDLNFTNQTYDGSADNYTGLTPTVTFSLLRAPTAVPEPASLSLLAAGLFILAMFARRRPKLGRQA
jgi:hypothetical protein